MLPESRFFESQRLRLHYVVWGDETKPPLLLIHGTRDHARSWDRTAEALARDFCVYAPDLRGHGDSQWATGGNYSIIDYALDLHALGEAVGRPPYTIVAHSLGGGVALEYAGAFPDKVARVVSIEGIGPITWTSRVHRPAHVRLGEWVENERKLEGRAPHVYATIEEATERMREANRHLTPALARHLTVEGVIPVQGGYRWKFDNYTRAGSPFEFNVEDARDLWNQIRSPILLVYGEESWGRREGPLDLSAFHDIRVAPIGASGHWVHHDQFETFLRLTREFLGVAP